MSCGNSLRHPSSRGSTTPGLDGFHDTIRRLRSAQNGDPTMKTDRAAVHLCLSLGLILASGLSAQVPRGLELRLNRTTTGEQLAPAVATAPGRGFVAAWH